MARSISSPFSSVRAASRAAISSFPDALSPRVAPHSPDILPTMCGVPPPFFMSVGSIAVFSGLDVGGGHVVYLRGECPLGGGLGMYVGKLPGRHLFPGILEPVIQLGSRRSSLSIRSFSLSKLRRASERCFSYPSRMMSRRRSLCAGRPRVPSRQGCS